MKTAGIIAEYNPFHNGHAYHIAETRRQGCTHIVAVMSGNVVQRGDIAVLDAHARAEMAVRGGADLVIELPPPCSCGAAKDFARAGVHILKGLRVVDILSFGSECADIGELCSCAAAVSQSAEGRIAELFASGLTYPQAVAALFPQFEGILQGANNTLALEYIQAIKGSGITPFTVKRTVGHDSAETSTADHNSAVESTADHDSAETSAADHDSGSGVRYASASEIRRMMAKNQFAANFMPFSFEGRDVSTISAVEAALLFKLASASEEEIKNAPYTKDGIAERMIKARKTAGSLSELYSALKTRNVTHARVRRAVLLAALGACESDMRMPEYARVLAANKRGLEILAAAKDRASIPISTSLAELAKISPYAKRCAEMTELAARLRWMARREPGERYISEYSKRFSVVE